MPAFIISILSKSSDFHKCLCPIKTFPFHFFGLCFFSVRLAFGADKNVQSRRISVSSPYNRTAETDFGERKSEYDKTQATRRADCLPSFKSISVKGLAFINVFCQKSYLPFHFFGLCFFSIPDFISTEKESTPPVPDIRMPASIYCDLRPQNMSP